MRRVSWKDKASEILDACQRWTCCFFVPFVVFGLKILYRTLFFLCVSFYIQLVHTRLLVLPAHHALYTKKFLFLTVLSSYLQSLAFILHPYFPLLFISYNGRLPDSLRHSPVSGLRLRPRHDEGRPFPAFFPDFYAIFPYFYLLLALYGCSRWSRR